MTHLAHLTSPALAALIAGGRTVVAVVPVGAVEPHGPHAPLGTDLTISEGVCRRAAEALADDESVAVLVAPALPYGVTRYGAAFAGAVGITEETLAALVGDVCRSLAGTGLTRVALGNSHFEPEHVATLRAAADALSGEGLHVALLEPTRRANAARLTEEFRSGSCHAGRYETSLVLADAPELIDAAAMAGLPELPVDMPAAMSAGRTDFVAMGMAQAYCGAPAEATAEEGRDTFATLTAMLIELVQDLAAR